IQSFFSWFQSHNGYIDTASMDVIQLPLSEGGRGAVALRDIPEGHTVFSIPRSLVLSTRTSVLPSRVRLHEGWSGLILCMMWEAAQGSASKWSAYLDILPSTFDTPMFWNDVDLAELQGTSVVEKLGRDQAEKDYNEKVLPAVHSRPDLFVKEDIPTRYSLETYHLMGSRILSRSFTLEREEVQEDEEEEKLPEETSADDIDVANTSIGSAMDVDAPSAQETHTEEHENHAHEREEVAAEVVMIPLADILNARYETENVKLFYEPDCLKMVSTKPIKAGEQMYWNTYGDLPNAELLRAYGHIDYLPLPNGGFGNPGDVAELRADLLVQCLRIDWWLRKEAMTLPSFSSVDIPPALLAFTRLLRSDDEWDRAKSKGKLPKPKADADTLWIVQEALKRRLAAYPTTLEEDTELAKSIDALSLNQRHALVVRMGEKRVLEMFRAKTTEMLQSIELAEKQEKEKESAVAKARERQRKTAERVGKRGRGPMSVCGTSTEKTHSGIDRVQQDYSAIVRDHYREVILQEDLVGHLVLCHDCFLFLG
ncbi:hypothetical protein BDZ97DRAFT_1801404, partial [Flammula alnicola]